MYKAIIIEDEYLLANVIENYLGKTEGISLEGKFENPLDALKFLRDHSVDLIFLDIQMPLINGVELAKMIPKETAVVFTTAYSEYAVEGFELNALDYLLKPISFDRFQASIRRFLDSKQRPSVLQSNAALPTYITVKADGALHKIQLSDLIYIESLKEYLRYHTTDKKYMVYGSLTKLTEELSDKGFIRIHKSVIVSKNHISSIAGNQVVINDHVTLPVGRSFKNDVMKALVD